MHEVDDADFSVLDHRYAKKKRPTVQERRAKETRPVPEADKRLLRKKSDRREQMNLKVTSTFKARVWALAQNEDCAMIDIIERAVAFYAAHNAAAK
jgi:hypothetical protein